MRATVWITPSVAAARAHVARSPLRRLEILDAEAPDEGPPRCGWVPGGLAAVELALRFLAARAIVPRADDLVVVDLGDAIAAPSMRDLLAHPDTRVLDDPPVDEPPVDGPAPARIGLPDEESAALASDDAATLAAAAETAGDQGWVIRIATWMRLRDDALIRRQVPPHDPAWGEGAWTWWRADTDAAARALPDLLARAEAHHWPSLPRIRLAFAMTCMLRAQDLVAAGHLLRARDELDATGATEDALVAHLTLMVAHDRLGRSIAGMLEEAHARLRPDTSDVVRARLEDMLGVSHLRKGRVHACLHHFHEAARLARRGGAIRMALVYETRVFEVAPATGTVSALRTLCRETARRGSGRGSAVLLLLLADRLRREGAREEAREIYLTLERVHQAAASAVGLAQLALDEGDIEGAWASVQRSTRLQEVGGRQIRVLAEALLVLVHEHRQDWEAWDAALEAWPVTVRGGNVDVADILERAARLAASKGDPAGFSRALRAGSAAAEHRRVLGDTTRAQALLDQLPSWAPHGVTIPLGPLDLIEPVARGGSATIWRATHRELDRPVAVKVLTERAAGKATAQLEAELAATARLRHPHVVAVLDAGTVSASAAAATARLQAGASWVALEWVGGGDLAARCATLPWPACLAVLDQLLQALAHAHAHGVVHRDVKPENVLWVGDPDGTPVVRLGDFGLAGVGDGRIAGTPAYMAPEQIRGRGIGPWTDLYALGCVAYALVRGAPPFQGTLAEVRRAHLEEPPPAVEAAIPVPAGLADWTGCLLAKAPAARFPNAEAARRALLALGPPRSTQPVARPRGVPEGRTFDLDPEDPDEPALDEARRPLPSIRPWCPSPRSPYPRPLGRSMAGLGLPALVGRDTELAALWAALTSCDRTVRVGVSGPPGSGVSALLATFARQVRAAGCAHVVDLTAGVDAGLAATLALAPGRSPEDRAGWLGRRLWARPPETLPELLTLIPADEPVVLVAETPPDVTWAPHRRCLVVTRGDDLRLDRLALHQILVLVRDLAPIRPNDALRIARAADGNPGTAVRLVRAALEGDALIPITGGLGLRDAAQLSLDGHRATKLPDRVHAALYAVDLLGPCATPERVAAVWARQGLDGGGHVELWQGRWRLAEAGLAAELRRTRPDPTLVDACLDTVGGDTVTERWVRVGLLTRLRRAQAALDALASLAWHFPADVGDLDLEDAAGAVGEALAASVTSPNDPAWRRLALVQARRALVAGDLTRVGPALEVAESGPAIDEVRVRSPLLRAVHQVVLRQSGRALALVDDALTRPEIAADDGTVLRYRVLRATLAGDEARLGSLAEVAWRAGEPRTAGDALRNRARLLLATDRPSARRWVERAIDAYAEGGSPYGIGSALTTLAAIAQAEGNRSAQIASLQRAAELLVPVHGAATRVAWINLALARLEMGDAHAAAELAAASNVAGPASLRWGSISIRVLNALLAAEGPAEPWLAAIEPLEAAGDPLPDGVRGLVVAARDRIRAAGLEARAARLDALLHR